MSEHRATVTWNKETESFAYDDYNRQHDWIFENGHMVRASATPQFHGNPDCVDPEAGFVAALSSCHMLTFLAICSRKRIVVEKYSDEAVGFLEPNEDKKLVITKVVLRPRVEFAEGHQQGADALEALHAKSHHGCFLANSVKSDITVES